MQILWLCSWYPNPEEPQNGDFIQRHAQAVAGLMPLTVIYVSQYQPGCPVKESIEIRKTGQLTEMIVRFAFRPLGLALVDKVRFNLVFFHGYRTLLRNHFQEQGIPDLVHVHVPIKAGLLARWIRQEYRVPYLLSEHSGHYQPESPSYEMRRSSRYLRNLRRVIRDASMVINVSAQLTGIMRQLFAMPATRVIPNTVNTTFFRPAVRADGLFRFVHVSSMDPNKNPGSILRSFAALLETGRDAELLMIGPAPSEVRSLAGLPPYHGRVRFTGELDYPEVAGQIRSADVFLLFSGFENQPCVVLESLCCGVPVISSAVGGIHEVLMAGDGELVAPGDEAALLQAMLERVDAGSEDDSRRRVRAQHAAERFSYQVVGQSLVQLYQETLQQKSPGTFIKSQT